MTREVLSKPRLMRLHEVLSDHVERGDLSGLVALVSCHDDVHIETLGNLSLGPSAPMTRDTIFRIASLTKLVTAVSAMILVEECKLRLDDSIEPWVPELANRRVLRSVASEPDDTVPAKRAITLRDLLTFRMGFGSVVAPPMTHPIQRLVRDLLIGGDGPPLPALAPHPDEWLRRLGSLPWLAQPGERWLYHVSADVLGLMIARVSGRSLGSFMRERIFEPLGMRDTAFSIPAEKLERFPTSYVFNPQTQALVIYDDAANSSWRPEPGFESGGGGLVSTVDDYFAFSRMMLNKGRYGREQILSRASVELMTSDQLAPEHRKGTELFFGVNSSWGFGMSVDIKRDELYRVPGRFGWDGGLGTSAYIDPATGVIGILLTQRMMDSPQMPRAFSDFWTLTYAAVE